MKELIKGDLRPNPSIECGKCNRAVCSSCYVGWAKKCIGCTEKSLICSICNGVGLVKECQLCGNFFCYAHIASEHDIAAAFSMGYDSKGLPRCVACLRKGIEECKKSRAGVSSNAGAAPSASAGYGVGCNLPFARRGHVETKTFTVATFAGGNGPAGRGFADPPLSERSARTMAYDDAVGGSGAGAVGRSGDGGLEPESVRESVGQTFVMHASLLLLPVALNAPCLLKGTFFGWR